MIEPKIFDPLCWPVRQVFSHSKVVKIPNLFSKRKFFIHMQSIKCKWMTWILSTNFLQSMKTLISVKKEQTSFPVSPVYEIGLIELSGLQIQRNRRKIKRSVLTRNFSFVIRKKKFKIFYFYKFEKLNLPISLWESGISINVKMWLYFPFSNLKNLQFAFSMCWVEMYQKMDVSNKIQKNNVKLNYNFNFKSI